MLNRGTTNSFLGYAEQGCCPLCQHSYYDVKFAKQLVEGAFQNRKEQKHDTRLNQWAKRDFIPGKCTGAYLKWVQYVSVLIRCGKWCFIVYEQTFDRINHAIILRFTAEWHQGQIPAIDYQSLLDTECTYWTRKRVSLKTFESNVEWDKVV